MSKKWIKKFIGRFWDAQHYAKLDYGVQNGQITCTKNSPIPPDRFDRLISFFDLKELSFSFCKLSAATSIRNCTNDYNEYLDLYTKTGLSDVRKVILMLADWSIGQHFEVNGEVIANWIAIACAVI